MAFSDFIKKVKVLLQGESEHEEDYDSYREDETPTEQFYPARHSQGESGTSSRLAQRMADEYYDEDDENYYDEPPVTVYNYDDDDDYSEEDGQDDYENQDYEQNDEQDDDPFADESEQQDVPEEPLPTRTEVTLREIKRLSDKLDEETLRAYQMHLVKIKKETGAVSALTALRVLHEYVDDDDDDTDYVSGTSVPDLSAK